MACHARSKRDTRQTPQLMGRCNKIRYARCLYWRMLGFSVCIVPQRRRSLRCRLPKRCFIKTLATSRQHDTLHGRQEFSYFGLGRLRLVEAFCAGAKCYRRSGAPPPGLPPCIRRAFWPSFQIRPECSGNVRYYAVRGRHRLVLAFCAGAKCFRRPRLSRAISRAF